MADNENQTNADADRILRNHTIAAGAGILVPVPLLNIGVLTAIQLRMLKRLAKAYEVEFVEQRANALIGTLASVSLRASAHGLLSIVPGIGRSLALLGAPLFPAAATYALGRVFIKHFESGGTFLNFDETKAKDEFDEEVKEGKKVIVKNFAGVKP